MIPKSKLTEINAINFSSFVLSKQICVLQAKPKGGVNFNKYLSSLLNRQFKNNISFGWIDTTKITYSNRIIRELLAQMSKIGVSNVTAILPGYYLFKDGSLVAYHPSAIDPNEVNTQKDIVGAAVSALIIGFTERNASKGFNALVDALESSSGTRTFQFFKEMLSGTKSSYTQNRQKTVYEDALSKAYLLLSVASTSSDEEIKKAYRKMMLKSHPDRSQDDKERRNELTSEINQAYELIMKSRGKKK